MAKLYYNRIKRGEMTMEEVPVLWRAEVEAMFDEETAETD